MKNKDYSKWLKFALVFIAFTLCILKWLNILPNASIFEVWTSAACAYGICLGTMDFDIIADNLREKKKE